MNGIPSTLSASPPARRRPVMAAPRDGNEAYWRPRSEAFLAFMRSGPKTWPEIYEWSKALWAKGTNAKARHMVAWCETRGLLAHDHDKRWRSTVVKTMKGTTT